MVPLALLGFILLTLAGCVERQIIFTTDRSYGDVEIELDGHPIGKTPCTVIFHRYGVREWVARADGYEIASGTIDLAEPWYQYPPMDLIAEGILPWTIHDRHSVVVGLQPLGPRDSNEMYRRAQAQREGAERDLQAARDRQRREDPESTRSSR